MPTKRSAFACPRYARTSSTSPPPPPPTQSHSRWLPLPRSRAQRTPPPVPPKPPARRTRTRAVRCSRPTDRRSRPRHPHTPPAAAAGVPQLSDAVVRPRYAELPVGRVVHAPDVAAGMLVALEHRDSPPHVVLGHHTIVVARRARVPPQAAELGRSADVEVTSSGVVVKGRYAARITSGGSKVRRL
ncbi:hypothetical protein BHM03_00041813 [Ensete ventricosum]|nr:hypothetical protein BHM03_00041813 [Ensete ventricosum]